MAKISRFLLSCLNGVIFTNGTTESKVDRYHVECDGIKPVNLRYLYVKHTSVESQCKEEYDIEHKMNIGDVDTDDYYQPKVTCKYSDLKPGNYIIQPFGIRTSVNEKTCTLYMRKALDKVLSIVQGMSTSECARFVNQPSDYVNHIHNVIRGEVLQDGETFTPGLFTITYLARQMYDEETVNESTVHVFESFN